VTDLAAIARGAGLPHVASVDSIMGFGEAVIDAFAREELSVIVAKVSAVGPNHYGMDLALPENAFRFKRWIAHRTNGAPGLETRGIGDTCLSSLNSSPNLTPDASASWT
jgi:hypothetical protein